MNKTNYYQIVGDNQNAKSYMEISGTDIIELFKSGSYDLLAQGNNCFCTQGAGIAKEIVRNFPQVLVNDRKTVKGDATKLGTYYTTDVLDGKKVIGIYTQYDYGRDGKDRFQYDHFKNALEKINVEFAGKKILFSKIGGSLAGGNFNRIKQMILDTLTDMDVTFCYY